MPQLLTTITSPLSANGAVGAAFNYGTATSATPMTFGSSPLPPGLTLSGEAISGNPTSAGTFVVTLYANNSLGTSNVSLTITITDIGGGASASVDSDGDGVSDALEVLAGTDPNNPSDAPVKQAALIVDKTFIALGFLKTGKDSIKATLRLSLPTGFTTPSATVGVVFGDDSGKVTLDAKGKCPAGNVAAKVTTSKTGPGALFTYSLKNKDLRAALLPYGLKDATFARPGGSATIPVAVSLAKGTDKYIYVGEVKVLYLATQGRNGKANKAK